MPAPAWNRRVAGAASPVSPRSWLHLGAPKQHCAYCRGAAIERLQHQPPTEWIDKYVGKFDAGWDALREQTLANQKKLGVVPENCDLTARPQPIKAWTEMTADERKAAARLMEVYAGFAEHTDYHAGRFLDALEEMGLRNNTLFIYIAGDNGASSEGTLTGTYNEMLSTNGVADTVENILAHYDDLGTIRAYNHFPIGWAHAMDCPYQWTKTIASHWGGTRNGMALQWPKGIRVKGQLRQQFRHVIHIVPTILEVAGLPAPVQVHGVTQRTIEGTGMVYSFEDAKTPERHTTQYFEIFGNRGSYHEGWSAAVLHRDPFGGENQPWDEDEWELYEEKTDWSQAKNVAAQYPDELSELKDLFMIEAARYNVFPLDDRRSERMNPDFAGRPDPMEGRTALTLYPGRVHLMENTVPNVKNRSHTVSAELEVPREGAAGVIVAQGGRFGGWSLYVLDGKLKYCYNLLGMQRFYVEAKDPLPPGKVSVQYKFTYDGGSKPGAGGMGALYVGGKKVGEGRLEKTVPFQFSFDETLDVGCDLATPMSEDYLERGNEYKGAIRSVTIDIRKSGVAYYEPPENLYHRLMANQ